LLQDIEVLLHERVALLLEALVLSEQALNISIRYRSASEQSNRGPLIAGAVSFRAWVVHTVIHSCRGQREPARANRGGLFSGGLKTMNTETLDSAWVDILYAGQ